MTLRPMVTTQTVVQTHWWSKCIQFPLNSVLSYFHITNDVTFSLDFNRLQRIIYKEFLLYLISTTPRRHMNPVFSN